MDTITIETKGKTVSAPPKSNMMIQGVSVRLVFSKDVNREIPGLVRDVLKNSYLRRQVTA